MQTTVSHGDWLHSFSVMCARMDIYSIVFAIVFLDKHSQTFATLILCSKSSSRGKIPVETNGADTKLQ